MSGWRTNSGRRTFPRLYPSPSLPTAYKGTNGMSYAPGFSAGQALLVPTTSGATITLYDLDGAAVTSGAWNGGIAPSDMFTGCTAWAYMIMDAADGLLYVIGKTSAPAYRLCSINAAGTITDISGSDQSPSTAFGTAPAFAQTAYTTMRRIGGDGVGNFELLSWNHSGNGYRGQRLEFNYSTGAIVGDVSTIGSVSYPGPVNGNIWSLVGSQSNIAVGSFAGLNASPFFTNIYNIDNGKSVGIVRLPYDWPWPGSNEAYPVQWNGLIYFLSANNNASQGPRAFEVVEFNSWIDKVADFHGIL